MKTQTQPSAAATAQHTPFQWGRAHLNYMGDEGVEALYHRVSRQRERLEDSSTEADAVEGSEWSERHAYLCEVEGALEVAIGFLNGEHAAFHEAREIAKAEGRG
jgi:hypothetical protein